MARVKLSEYDAKRLLFPQQQVLSATTSTTSSEITKKFGKVALVVKIDQGIKKRGIQGLVKAGVDAKGAVAAIRGWGDVWSQFIIEPIIKHELGEEKYLSFEHGRDGWIVLTSNQGGINIETNWDSIRTTDPAKYQDLINKLEHYHIASLELNPYVMQSGEMIALDAAAEIDDASLGLPNIQQERITPITDKNKAPVEVAIAALDAATPASLKFRLINPSGAIWMLLSGGGASLVLADEVADQGMGSELANYGEYSGAPTDDDVYGYTKLILTELLKNNKKKKALVIAAGIANFTDVAKTFKGIIRAMSENSKKLKIARVKVFVRRGGPNEARGLTMMSEFLKSANIPHIVHRHEIPLTKVITEVRQYVEGKT